MRACVSTRAAGFVFLVLFYHAMLVNLTLRAAQGVPLGTALLGREYVGYMSCLELSSGKPDSKHTHKSLVALYSRPFIPAHSAGGSGLGIVKPDPITFPVAM